MSSAGRSFYGVLIAAVLIVSGAFAFPRVMEASRAPERSEEFQALIKSEFSFCAGSDLGVNCGCFSQKSGHIQSFSNTRARGYFYANQQDLARGQATRAC